MIILPILQKTLAIKVHLLIYKCLSICVNDKNKKDSDKCWLKINVKELTYEHMCMGNFENFRLEHCFPMSDCLTFCIICVCFANKNITSDKR